MVTLMMSMLIVAGILHATGFYFGQSGSRNKNMRHTGLALLLSGGGYAVMGFLGSLCCRYLTDPDLLTKTKWCSYGLLAAGVLMAWFGGRLAARTGRSNTDKKD